MSDCRRPLKFARYGGQIFEWVCHAKGSDWIASERIAYEIRRYTNKEGLMMYILLWTPYLTTVNVSKREVRAIA